LLWIDFAEYFAILFFLFGFLFLLFRQELKRSEASFFLAFFAAGLLLVGLRMLFLALDSRFVDLIADVLLFIVGLLLAFVANAKGEYFASRRIRK
jgi:hypothetical protein